MCLSLFSLSKIQEVINSQSYRYNIRKTGSLAEPPKRFLVRRKGTKYSLSAALHFQLKLTYETFKTRRLAVAQVERLAWIAILSYYSQRSFFFFFSLSFLFWEDICDSFHKLNTDLSWRMTPTCHWPEKVIWYLDAFIFPTMRNNNLGSVLN